MMRTRIAAALVVVAAVVGLTATASAAPTGGQQTKLKVGPGVDTKRKTIHVSALLPLTGAQAGPEILYGLDAYFKYVNANGGIKGCKTIPGCKKLKGYKIKYDAQDTQFNPTVAIQQYQKDKDRAAMFAIILGTPTLGALAPQLTADGITVAPISNSGVWVRNPNMAPVQGTFESATVAIAQWVMKNRDGASKTWCEMKENDPLGAQFGVGAAYASRALGFKIKKTVTFNITDPNMTGQVTDLKDAGCNVIIYEGATGASILAATAAQQLNYNPLWLMPQISYLAQYATSPQAAYLTRNWVLWDYGVAWNDIKVKGQALMREMLKKYERNPTPNIIIQWGWQNGITTVAVLNRAMANGDLSRAGILKAASELKWMYFGGMFPPYYYGGDASKRRPSAALNIVKVNPRVPTGLATVQRYYVSRAAQDYLVTTFP